MNFNEAMQMLGTKLQGKYGHLGFKYKKSDKTLTRQVETSYLRKKSQRIINMTPRHRRKRWRRTIRSG